MNKYVRICWNTSGWQQPTGEARHIEHGQTYAKTHGFGHEEWLFNYTHLYRNFSKSKKQFKYGYVQPIEKFHSKYAGQTFDLLLYTASPQRQKLAVAIIRNAYIPTDEERHFIKVQMEENGQLQEMADSLGKFDLHPPLSDLALVNIRFTLKDVVTFDPLIELPTGNPASKQDRYHPYNWNDGYVPGHADINEIPSEASDVERSEEMRRRCAIAGIVYSPEHVRLQNEIYRFLCAKHSTTNVAYEKNAVDLTVRENSEVIFYELKILPTVRKCIREASGQLLEYCHYHKPGSATKLIILGQGFPQPKDIQYLAEIRSRYKIPIYYQRWNRELGCFDEAV